MRLKITSELWARGRDAIKVGKWRVACCPIALAIHGNPLTDLRVGANSIMGRNESTLAVMLPPAAILARQRFDDRCEFDGDLEFALSAERFIDWCDVKYKVRRAA